MNRCSCCGGAGAGERGRPVSAARTNAASILCKGRHAKRSCLLCKFEQTPGTPRLLTVAEDLSAEWWLSTGGQGFMRADSRVGGVAELRCCTAHVDVDVRSALCWRMGCPHDSCVTSANEKDSELNLSKSKTFTLCSTSHRRGWNLPTYSPPYSSFPARAR
jgi:hypothetical protein